MSRARLAPRAERELLAAADWVAKDNPAAARGLREAVAAAVLRIGEHPGCGVTRLALAAEPYRFLTLTGYPYILVYNAASHPPLIVRFIHGARDLPELLRDLS
jgi:toxin ParE1/3/4